MAYTRPASTAADLTWEGLGAYTRPASTAADLAFDGGTVNAIAAAESMLGAPAVLGAGYNVWAAAASPLGAPAVVVSTDINGWASAASPLGAPSVYGALAAAWAAAPSPLGAPAAFGATFNAWAAAPSMLGSAQVLANYPVVALCVAASPLGAALAKAFHDFSALLGDTVTHYVMDLTTPDGTVRVPISSWQATLQTGASNYVQCVVPAAADWTAAINAATAFRITRTAEPAGLPVVEYEMAAAPLETISIAQGPTNYTATLSGYSEAFAVDDAPPAATDRTLSAVRSATSTSGKMRARCAIDWMLRPAQRAFLPDGSSFIVGYINYYQPQGFDSYMDVGE